MKITHCQVNHMTSPVGFALGDPTFSWLVEDAQGKEMAAARLTVWREQDSVPPYDSGKRTDLSFTGFAPPLTLEPRTRYRWQVQAWTDAGETAVSDLNWFETGKMEEPWTGQWLTCPRGERMPVFQKKLPLTGNVRRARLYICGLGLYEAHLTAGEVQDSRHLTDETRVGNEVLTPYCNNYNRWLQAQTYDVTEALRTRPALNVWLGVGWYMGRFGFFGAADEDAYYGHDFHLIAEVHVEYEDGETAVFGTDESWEVWRSNITFCNIYDGEWRDDTLPPAPVERATLDKEPPLLPTDRYSLPVHTQERRKPVELIHTPAGEQVLDLGQNLAGGFCLRVRAAAGTAIRLQFGEVLQDGCFYNGNLRTAKAEYRYISDGAEREICPHFTYYGYRYVKIESIDDLKIDDFTALVWFSNMEETGTITTGHEKVNRLISNAHWGLKGNFLDVPTDCPQRDERMGWTGDAQVFSATACYFRDTYAFYRKYLHDMAAEQADLEGKVPNVVPSFGFHDTACVWGDAAVLIPWNLYLFYGDQRILQEQYDSMKGWVEYIRRTDGNNQHWKEVFHFGDWLALDHPNPKPEQCMGGTDEGYIAYVYYARSAELVAKAAAILGYREDEERYTALSRRIREDIQQEYFSPRGKCCVNTQTGMVLALQNDLSPRPEVVVQDLKKRFDQTEGKLQTGFVGTPLLCPTLTQCGLERLAFDLLLREEYPGWLYEVNHGATTVWERWNSVEPDGHISSTGMNSLNHYAYGSIVEWLFRDVAGLEPIEPEPGFRRVQMHPIYDLRLGKLEMQYRSPAGLYRVRWEIQGRRTVTLEVSVPFGCQADLTLYAAGTEVYEDRQNPMFSNVENGICHLTTGSYRVIYRANRPLGCALTAHNKVWELFANEETANVLRAAGVGQSDIAAQHWNDPFDTLGETKECTLTPETIAQVAQKLNEL